MGHDLLDEAENTLEEGNGKHQIDCKNAKQDARGNKLRLWER